MREIQTPQKEIFRSSDLANRKSKESLLKKPQKIAKKNLIGAFASVSDDTSPEITKDASTIASSSECFDPAFSPCILDSPEAFHQSDLTPNSNVTSISDRPGAISFESDSLNKLAGSEIGQVELDMVVDLLMQARIQVLNSTDADNTSKKLLDVLIKVVTDEFYSLPEGKDWLADLISKKTRIALLCFFFWSFFVSAVYFFSGVHSYHHGCLPT